MCFFFHDDDDDTTYTQHDQSEPEYKDQAFSLLVDNPTTATIDITVKDKSNVIGGEDALIGKRSMPIRRLMWVRLGNTWNGWLDVKVSKWCGVCVKG